VTPTLLLASALAATAGGAASAPPCAPCIRWEVSAEQASRLAAAEVDLHGVALLVPSEAGAAIVEALHARGASLAQYTHADDVDGVSIAHVDAVVLSLDLPVHTPAERAYRLKTAATRLRARQPALRIGVEAGAAALDGDAAAYVDFVVGDGGAGRATGAERWVRTGAESPAGVLAATQAAPGTVMARWPGAGGPDDPPFALARLGALLGPALVPLADVEVGCDAVPSVPTSICDGAAFLGQDGGAVVIVRPRAAVRSVTLRAPRAVAVAADLAARLHDLVAPLPARDVEARAAGNVTRIEVPALEHAFVLQVEGWGSAHGLFGAGVDVMAGRELTVDEVLARHQAWALRQREAVPRSIASGSLVITFQSPGLSAPVVVTAQVTTYSGPQGTEVEQHGLRLNGLDLDGGGVPRLPIVEPERVAAAPLSITLDRTYRYRLDGRGRAKGRDCYRVAFEPAVEKGRSFHGRAWIEAAAFALVRMEAVQTGLRGPIVSSQQTDELAPLSHQGRTLWLLARTAVHQVYEGPGQRTPIDRVLVIDRQEPDPPDFEQRLAAAHASDAVMLRETADGFQYLRKARAGERKAAGAGARVPAGKATAVRTVALGLIVDPNIGDPLPFVGAGYSDFDLFGSGTQLSAFLAGAFAQVSWSAPSLLGSRWTLQASGLASLVEYNDRVFRRGLEQYDENLRQRPARLAVDLAHALGTRWRARAGYELSYTRLRRSDLTAPAFQAPASVRAHGLRVALDALQGPWTGSLWWRPARRQCWRAWGFDGAPEGAEARATYHRFGLTVARAVIASPRASGRVELAAMAGSRLDRFSRYAFDAFENRLTGYPTASVRYDRGLVARSAFVWQALPSLRLQGWADAAHVRDAGFDFKARTLAGVGAGLEAALPFRTLLAVEWGFGIQGRDRDGRQGTHTLRATAYRVF